MEIKDTIGKGPTLATIVHFKFQREDKLSVNDKMAGLKHVHYPEVPLNVYDDQFITCLLTVC